MPEPSVPIACTLPPDQLGGRLAEFDALFAAHLVRFERPAPTRLRLVLGEAAGEPAVRELLTRERQCCAFIEFTVGAEGGRLLADLEAVRSALRTVLASDCDSLTDCRCDLRPLLLGEQA